MENQTKETSTDPNQDAHTVVVNWSIKLPLRLNWKPSTNITTWELANAMPYLLGRYSILEMPDMTKNENSFFRHFEITDPNKSE